MTTSSDATPQPVFQTLSGDAIETGDLEVTEIESLCMRCHEDGITRLLLTKIPFFREVIISSFACEYCNFSHNELTNASSIQETGSKYTFKMTEKRDLSRNIVRSEHCSILIPELEFEIPIMKTNKGIFTTVEGLLTRAFDDIERDQPLRRVENLEIADQIDAFLEKAKRVTGLVGEEVPKCTVVFQDDSGNSYVENPHAPYPDPRLRVDHYARTNQMTIDLGYEAEEKHDLEAIAEEESNEIPEATGGLDLNAEVLTIPSNCPNCNIVCQANFKTVSIPFFKDVIIMATVCDACGYKSNEVKSGSGFSNLAQKISLSITGIKNSNAKDTESHSFDLARDILKSETCNISIPELDFEIGRGAIEGKFTTLEGLLEDVKRTVKRNPFTTGDSAFVSAKANVDKFVAKIDMIIKGELAVTLVLDDPAGNSYIQNPHAPDNDPRMEVVDYERTHDQNEDLGLNQMNVDDYDSGDVPVV